MKRQIGQPAVTLLAAGILIAAACGPRARPFNPPTLEAFSRAGAPPDVAKRDSGDPPEDGAAADESGGIYVRASERGNGFVTNVSANDKTPRAPSTGRLYRWRDQSGHEHVTDSKPPPGAQVLADVAK